MTYPIEYKSAGSGPYFIGVAGENLPIHTLVYRSAAQTWMLADADTAATMDVVGLTLEAISSGSRGTILLWGYVADTAWTWTVGGQGGRIYASTTPGALTQTAPTPPETRQVVAVAFFPTGIWFDPSGLGAGQNNAVEGASFIVDTDGTYFWAKSGPTGDIVYGGPNDEGATSGLDAATVINATLGAISSGRIVVKKGAYPISASIDHKSYVTLEFEDGAGLYPTVDIPVINVIGNSWVDPIIEPKIKGLTIWRSEVTPVSWIGTGIYGYYIKWLLLEDVRIQRIDKGLELGLPDTFSYDYITMRNVNISQTKTFGAKFGYGTRIQSRNFRSDWCDPGQALYLRHAYFAQFNGTFLGNSGTFLKIENVTKAPRGTEFRSLNMERNVAGGAPATTRAIEITSAVGFLNDYILLNGIDTGTTFSTAGMSEEIYVSGPIDNLVLDRVYLQGGANGGINIADANVTDTKLGRLRWAISERIVDNGTRTIKQRPKAFESFIVMVRGAGAVVAGNIGVAYVSLAATDWRWRPDNFLNVDNAYFAARWQSNSNVDGIELYNNTDAASIATHVPGAIGPYWTLVDITTTLEGYAAEKTFVFRTKGNTIVGPDITFAGILLRVRV